MIHDATLEPSVRTIALGRYIYTLTRLHYILDWRSLNMPFYNNKLKTVLFITYVILICFNYVSTSLAKPTHHVSSHHNKNNNGNTKLRKNSNKHRSNENEEKSSPKDNGGGEGDSNVPQNQKLPGGSLVALPDVPPIGATPPNSHAGAVIPVTNLPAHKLPQEQPMTINSYTDNSGGNVPPTMPVASPKGVNTGI